MKFKNLKKIEVLFALIFLSTLAAMVSCKRPTFEPTLYSPSTPTPTQTPKFTNTITLTPTITPTPLFSYTPTLSPTITATPTPPSLPVTEVMWLSDISFSNATTYVLFNDFQNYGPYCNGGWNSGVWVDGTSGCCGPNPTATYKYMWGDNYYENGVTQTSHVDTVVTPPDTAVWAPVNVDTNWRGASDPPESFALTQVFDGTSGGGPLTPPFWGTANISPNWDPVEGPCYSGGATWCCKTSGTVCTSGPCTFQDWTYAYGTAINMQLALGGSNPTMLTFWIRYGAYPTLGPVSISCTSTAVSGAVTTTYESFYTGTLPTPISAANTWYQENLPLSGGSWDANFSSMNWTNLNTVKFYNYYP